MKLTAYQRALIKRLQKAFAFRHAVRIVKGEVK